MLTNVVAGVAIVTSKARVNRCWPTALVAGVEQFLLVDDVVAVEDGAALRVDSPYPR